jgi:hypothetical protein
MMQQTMAEILSYLDRVEQQVWDGRGSVSYVSARIRGIIMKGLE